MVFDLMLYWHYIRLRFLTMNFGAFERAKERRIHPLTHSIKPFNRFFAKSILWFFVGLSTACLLPLALNEPILPLQ